ncbi:unnamed protein product [Prorocentrum cordatum]|uniref:Uncharacterized protein n=1 Tax=Prorocentrum cordatum TaxID=2364126 RepID=A0ABN9SN40_9DINO|nr:unnamed protein product [Polarella glacialis]
MTWLSAQSAQTEQSPRGTNSQAALASHTIWWPLLPQQAEPGLPTTEPWSVEQVGEGSASQRGAAVESLHDSPRPQTTCCPGAPQQESPTSARGRCWLSKPRHDAGVGAGAGVGTNAGSAVGSCTGAGVEGPELAGVGASAGSAVGSDTGAGVEGPELVRRLRRRLRHGRRGGWRGRQRRLRRRLRHGRQRGGTRARRIRRSSGGWRGRQRRLRRRLRHGRRRGGSRARRIRRSRGG